MNWVQSNGGNGKSSQALIHLRNVMKVYRTPAGDFLALKGISLDVKAGEFLVITGKSGAGKTTLVNMISGVDRLTAGEVWVGEQPVHSLDENSLALWRGRHVGVIYQSFQLIPSLSLLQNVMLPMDLSGLYRRKKSPGQAMELLRQVGLEDHAHKLPAAISGGQQQRVAIARSLANDPPLIVADEPTGRLDSATASSIFEVFQALVDRGKTILMVTHDMTLAEQASRRVHLVDGELAADEDFE